MKTAPSYAAPPAILLFFSYYLILIQQQLSSALPMCTDLRAPTNTNGTLSFCLYNGTTCCDSNKDLQLHKQFQSMNVSNKDCAAILKSVLCATCDPYSAELYKVKSGQERAVPAFCNTNSSSGSYSSKQATTTTTTSFCSTVWNICKDIHIKNSPFEPSLQVGKAATTQDTNTSTTLINLWQSETEFCKTFGAPTTNTTSLCYTGEQVSLENVTETTVQPKGICLEKISNGSYINMVAHPDGSNRAFFSNLPGKIWLAGVPEQGKGDILDLDESDPFVDLTDQVLFDTIFGMMGIAFHPDFAKNGRFFASYNCDRQKSPGCNGRCACNSDVDCDPSKLNSTDSSQPCQYQSVIAEFSANGSESADPSVAKSAKPIEVRRIFTMGLPYTNNHGGQILFGPEDKYLYLMMGDGGSRGDPYNFAQNKKSLLGKVLRLDVDRMPSKEEIAKQGRWGNYSIPRDNPYSEDKEMEQEIWAMGFRNPWRCSFDAERPSYFVCGDVGQDRYEEVDLVTKGGNYGWRVYEGPLLSQKSLASTNSSNSQELIFPVSGYNHSSVNDKIGSAAISGGLFYRSQTDPCMYGSYLYGDLYANNMWIATETPKDSGNFTTTGIPFTCAKDSPTKCSAVPGSTMPALGYIYSFGQDNRKDIFVLASSGVYRVVRPSRCNYDCSKEVAVPVGEPSPSPSSNSGVAPVMTPWGQWLLGILVLLFEVVV